MVIADTSPINYLILIRQIDLLPQLFDRVARPSAVQAELMDPDAPPVVRRLDRGSSCLARGARHDMTGWPQESGLDEWEAAAIALAEWLHADILLIDERKVFA